MREQGIPLETFYVTGSDGRRIAAYRFGDPDDARPHKLGGRGIWPKDLKAQLVESSRSRCAICATPYRARELQIDHRVPYEVGGDWGDGDVDPTQVMLLSGSCNRSKSWTCEHCDNLTGPRDSELCKTCYWGNPEDYSHIALRQMRRVDLVWDAEEIAGHDRISRLAIGAGEGLADFIKKLLARAD